MHEHKIRIALIWVIFIFAQNFVSIAQTETSSPTDTQIIHGQLNRGDILVYTSFDTAWKVNLDTGERTLFYQNAPETTLRGWSIDRNQQVIYIVEVPHNKVLASNTGIFDLVQIDLLTGKHTLLLQKENLIDVNVYPPDAGYILLTYFPHVEKFFAGLQPKVCLFSLSDHTCTELEREAAGTLASHNQRYWLTDKTFLAFYEAEPFLVTQVNLYNNNILHPLDNWIIYSFAPIRNTRELLLIARPKQLTSSDSEFGFYRLNVDTLILSEKVYPAPKLDGAQMQFSSDGKYLLFAWQSSNHPKLQVIDYEKWNIVFDMQDSATFAGLPATLEWLPDKNMLVGQIFYTNNHNSSFIQLDPFSGKVKTLFTTDEPLHFTVVQ